jgi:hypothetical protein
MKDRIVVAFVTVLIFSAGLAAGFWAARQKAVPPPPMGFMGEFGGGRALYGGDPGREPVDRAGLAAQIERLEPQIKFYRTHLQQIDADFESDLRGVLNPDQQAKRDEYVKRRAAAMAEASQRAAGRPLQDDEILRLQQPSMRLFRMIVMTRELDDMVRNLNLDDAQRARVLELLRQRRESFLTLVDSVSPPSVVLSRLASQIQRLEQPKP